MDNLTRTITLLKGSFHSSDSSLLQVIEYDLFFLRVLAHSPWM